MKKESLSIRLLYNTVLGRFFLKFITKVSFSNLARIFLDSRFSKPMIKRYIKNYKINMDEYEECSYKSFNDFFVRKRKLITADTHPASVISPCDGYLTVYKIDEASVFNIKNSSYSLKELLQNEALAKKFKGGMCFIYRLAPHHFHRYSFIDDGRIVSEQKIAGILHCVRPVACDRYKVYIQNQREYTLIEADNLGAIIQMEIGAIIVGRINNHKNCEIVSKGQEKGYFEFGGSTIIVLTEKDAVKVNEEILVNSEKDVETDVKIGAAVGMVL